MQGDMILFPKAAVFRVQKELTAWYIRQAREIISQQVEFYAKRMNASYTDLTFSDTKSQWGRCTHENKLQFSWRLVMAPLLVINYVVVHELVHTIEKNHSRSFWSKVRFHNPSYRQQIKWLAANGHALKV
jgi:predicted metal-dependent hydrolase